MERERRKLVAVIGDSRVDSASAKIEIAREVGRLLVDARCRVITGGLGGVMAAAMEGARSSAHYTEGDTIGILPGHDPRDAAPSADIVIATGLHLARNLIVANSDAVIAIGGGAGTLSEIALAWQLRRPIVGLAVDGWSRAMAGSRVDQRRRQAGMEGSVDQVHPASTPEQAVRMALELIPRHGERMRQV